MANEATKTTNLFMAKGGVVIGTAAVTQQRTVAGVHAEQGSRVVTQSADVEIDVGDVDSTDDYDLEIVNLDPTNYIELSTGTGGGFAAGVFSKVLPLWSASITPGAPIYAKANTANCLVAIRAVEA